MREILFKAKRLDNGEWVEGYYLRNEDRCYICPYISFASYRGDNVIRFGNWYEVDPETVCQYTGLKDSKDNKVFEGDIVKYTYRLDYECYVESLKNPEEYKGYNYGDIFVTNEVVYGIEYDYPAFDLKNHFYEYNALSRLNNGDWHYEVIGTIFDNPELLEAKE